MKFIRLLFMSLVITSSVFANQCFAEEANVNDLISQLKGDVCQYEAAVVYIEPFVPTPCKKRGLFASLNRRNDKYYCIADAAVCLAGLEKRAQNAVPELLQSLKKYKDVDTGDGIIPIRGVIAESLGAIGDSRGIGPLIDLLQTNETTELSSGAAGVSPRPGTYYGSVIKALGMFGSDAKEAVSVIIPFLKKDEACSAAEALGKIGDPQAIQALTEALKHPSCYYAAADALGNFGTDASSALPELYKLKDGFGNAKNYQNNKVISAIKALESGSK